MCCQNLNIILCRSLQFTEKQQKQHNLDSNIIICVYKVSQQASIFKRLSEHLIKMTKIALNDRILIKNLRKEKHWGARRMIVEFPSKAWSIASVNRLIHRIDNDDTVERKLGSGRPKSARTAANIETVSQYAAKIIPTVIRVPAKCLKILAFHVQQ